MNTPFLGIDSYMVRKHISNTFLKDINSFEIRKTYRVIIIFVNAQSCHTLAQCRPEVKSTRLFQKAMTFSVYNHQDLKFFLAVFEPSRWSASGGKQFCFHEKQEF